MWVYRLPRHGDDHRHNYIQGFDPPCDSDSTVYLDIGSNTVRNCRDSWIIGYSTQGYARIRDNTSIDSADDAPYRAGLVIANSDQVKCNVVGNTFVDTLPTPQMSRAVDCTGHGDYADVTIKGNRFYMVNGTLTEQMEGEYADTILPRVFAGNLFHNQNGAVREYREAHGNVSGAAMFDAARFRSAR